MNQINMSEPLSSIFNHSTMRLHHAINEFKRKEEDRITINNKINKLKQKCQTNRKKAKIIEYNIGKMNQLKKTFRRNKQEIAQCLSLEKENQKEKLQRERSLRSIAKDNMRIVRNMIAKDKNYEYLKIKQKQRENQLRITQNIQKSLHQKRQRSLEIKLKQEQMRMSRTIYMQKKRLKTLRSSQAELKPLEQVTKITENYIQNMKMLQRQMINKFNRTSENLSRSMIKQRMMQS